MSSVTRAPELGKPSPPTASRLKAVRSALTVPAVSWAAVGSIALAFEAYLMIRWVTGPYFKNVPSGPSVPPTWMRISLITGEIISPLLAAFLLYWTLLRPWLKTRTVATDGLFFVACGTIVWQDVISNYAAPYLTYNSYLLNMGSWVQGIPGWSTYGHPGAMTVDPLLFTAPNYAFAPLLVMWAGGWYMNRIRRRWPRVSDAGLIAIVFATMLVAWPILEGGMYVPLGFFTFPGGTLSLFPDAYDKYPIPQVVCASAFMVTFTAVRYFKNARGQTIAERGIERLGTGLKTTTVVRFLALVGISNVIFLATYNVPLGAWTGISTGAWPRDLQRRSYLTDYICGDRTGRLCPHSGGTKARIVLFGSGSGGPFSGPFLGNTK